MARGKKEPSENKRRENIWMYVSIGLGLAFLVALLFAIASITKTNNGIGQEKATKIVSDLIKTTQNIDVNIVNVIETNGLYKIILSANGQNAIMYITLDGKNIIPGEAVISIENILSKNKSNDANKIYSLPDLEGSSVLGPEKAKIQIYGFLDYQCPFCGLAFGSPWTEAYKTSQYGPMIGTIQKIEKLAREGKIAFRHFPLAFLGEESVNASNAVLCAKEQGKYWEMHDILFNAQTEKENDGKYAKDKLKLLAKEVSDLNYIKFDACIDKDIYVDKIKALTINATTVLKTNTGTAGTPTFYIVVDANLGKEKIDAIAKAEGYKVGPTSDSSKYVIIADPQFSKISKVINALTT